MEPEVLASRYQKRCIFYFQKKLGAEGGGPAEKKIKASNEGDGAKSEESESEGGEMLMCVDML